MGRLWYAPFMTSKPSTLVTALVSVAASFLVSCTEADESAQSLSGAVTTASGLGITEITPGSDVHPKAKDTVVVHYHGTFPDGRVFDSSVDRGKPATFPLRRVIKCWTEGVQLIGVGGKSRLVCPPSIAYGERGKPPKIPKNATLIFEVELLEIK